MSPINRSKRRDRKKALVELPTLRERVYEIIFEADTPAGKTFDVGLLILILVSVVATSLETMPSMKQARYQPTFLAIEWTVTILFTIEYVLRILCVKRPLAYIFSFYGLVDLLSILPTFVGLTLQNRSTSRMAMLRALRLLRVFRVLELGWFVSEANALYGAFWQSRAKIVVFLFTVLIVVTLTGTLMYVLEGPDNASLDLKDVPKNERLNSIPDGIYWAVVTMTTVGYGDIVPITPMGKFISALLILVGYSLIIVPTGFVSAELVQTQRMSSARACASCMAEGHQHDAKFCRQCGDRLR